MARWKARVEFLLSVIGLLCLSLTVEALQGKMCQDSLILEGGRSVRAKISGGTGHPWGIFFDFCKTRHILLSDSANCTVLRAVVLTQYRRVTDGRMDGQTDTRRDGIAKRRAVKSHLELSNLQCCHFDMHALFYTFLPVSALQKLLKSVKI